MQVIQQLQEFLSEVSHWKVWSCFSLVPSSPPTTGNLFGFAEYLSALALLLVVLGTSDYRYRYRLLLMKYNLRLASVWVVTAIGVGILGIDVWFQNKLPVPIIMANANNLKAILAVIFLAFLIFTLAVAWRAACCWKISG